MEVPSHIVNTLSKYLSNTASAEELDILTKWLQQADHKKEFFAYVKTNYVVDALMNDFNTEQAKEQLLSKIKRDRDNMKKRKLFVSLRYAASIVVFLGIGYLYVTGYFGNKTESLTPEEEQITLTLGDKTLQVLEDDGQYQITNASGQTVGKQQGTVLTYEEIEPQKLVYHTLTIPYGKRFSLILSDGTEAHLNAGSRLRYPVAFIKGQKRQVFLEGEAYFDVEHDAANAFVVTTDKLDVQVLGTEFNVASYPEDTFTDVMLLEGKVALDNAKSKVSLELSPGELGRFDHVKEIISVKQANGAIHTAWINGSIIFRNAPFGTIIKKLERYYNIEILNTNDALENETFNARFHVEKETLPEVLEYFNKVYEIEYQIMNNKVIIK